jgi:hypothetical protein
MPSKARSLLALFTSIVAAGFVYGWPVGPLWRAGPDAGRLDGFSSDGRIIVTTRVQYQKSPEVRRWEATTGKLLSNVEMQCSDAKSLKDAWPSNDGSMVLVGEGKPVTPSVASFETGIWFLHDGITGKRLLGPFPDVASFGGRHAFSADGRWFRGLRGDPGGGYKSLSGPDVFSTDTGKLVFRQSDKDGMVAGGCMFDPTGRSALLFWDKKDGDDRWQTVQVVELPSGKEGRLIQLPWRTMVRSQRWDGRFLEMIAREPDKPIGDAQWWSCTYDLSQEPAEEPAEDPVLQTRVDDAGKRINWMNGSNWLIYFHFESRPPKRRGLAAGWIGSQHD